MSEFILFPSTQRTLYQSKRGTSFASAFSKLDFIDGTNEETLFAQSYFNYLEGAFSDKSVVSITRNCIDSTDKIEIPHVNIDSIPCLMTFAATIMGVNGEWKNYRYDISYRLNKTVKEILQKHLKPVVEAKDKFLNITGQYPNAIDAARILVNAAILHTRIPTNAGNLSAPEVIVGPVPLYSVQRIERAMSDRKVKYRAIGDVFLAHQKGTKDSLRIDGTLMGPQRFMFLTSLLILQMEGSATSKNFAEVLEQGSSAISTEYAENLKNQSLNYEFHRTFPIITDVSIMTDMFLQTLEWHRSVEDGVDVIKYHLLFRKFEEPNKFIVFEPKFKDDDPNKGVSGAKKLVTQSNLKWWRRTEYWLDLIWKMKNFFGEIYPRAFIGFDQPDLNYIDREALSNVSKVITSFQAGLLGLG